MKHTVFFIEDDATTRELYGFWLGKTDWSWKGFPDAESCLTTIASFEPSVICVDLGLPGMSGMEALGHIHRHRPRVPVIVITASDKARAGVDAIKAGAADYVVKPLDAEEFLGVIGNAIRRYELELEVQDLRSQMIREKRIAGLVGHSSAINQMTAKLGLVLDNSVPVLLEGETGTGKELVARTIHNNSDRAGRPFVAVNCGAIPKELQESHFFGHEKGAFTGAQGSRAGFFEEANGGTVFLDEIGEMSRDAQVTLLRVLQEKSVRRVGGNREFPVNVRIISATHRSLRRMVDEGTFREDLYFRLVVFPIAIPPLRERVGDVPLLIGHFLRQFSAEAGLAVPEVTEAALDCLASHPWPGNVRELQNAIQFALLSSRGEPIEVAHLPEDIAAAAGGLPAGGEGDVIHLHSPVTGRVKRFQDLEKEILVKVRDLAGGNITQAAQMLGVGRATFYRKMQEMGLTK